MTVGASDGQHDKNPNFYTIQQGPGTKFYTSTATAYNCTLAVSVFGAALSAQSGWGTWVQEYWNFSSNATHNQLLSGATHIRHMQRRHSRRTKEVTQQA